MSDGLTIRAAQAGDMGAVLELYKYLNPGDEIAAGSYAEHIWQRLISTAGTTVLLGKIAAQAVCTCTLIITPNLTRRGRPFAVIENVVTHGDFRKRGFGLAVLKEAIASANAEDCYKIVLTTGSRRESTLAFYEKAGFLRNTRTVFEIRS